MELSVDQPLNLELNLTMGQAFRWTGPDEDRWFCGVVQGILIKIRRTSTGLDFRSSEPEESVKPLLEHYFRLDEDVRSTYDELSQSDSKMRELVKRHWGLRILRQEPWECLVSYICSNANSVHRIKGIVEDLSAKFGEPLSMDVDDAKSRGRSFPTPERLAKTSPTELKQLVVMRRRASCIHQVAIDVAAQRLDLEALRRMSYDEAKQKLVIYRGIGPKIADCVLLFSLDKLEAFPVDRHVIRGLCKRYLGHDFPNRKPPTHPSNLEWAKAFFGANAGYASQFIFQDERPDSRKV